MLVNNYFKLHELSTHKFECDASEIGLKPGNFPLRLSCGGGNGLDLLLVAKRNVGQDILCMKYVQEFGCIELIVWND